MRWMWIDRIVELVPRVRMVAVKNVSMAEEHLHDHFAASDGRDAMPLMPASLIIEGMAQTAGILVADALDFRKQVVLAKVGQVRFEFEAVPGDTIELLAEIKELSETGSFVNVSTRIGDRDHASAELFLAHLEAGTTVPRLFRPEEIMGWLSALRLFEVAVDEDGRPAHRPA